MSSLARKDFNEIASALASIEDLADRTKVTDLLIPVLRRSNARFYENLFRGHILDKVREESGF